MAKRLTDTNKWDKTWYFDLKPIYKLFWIFICDKCTHSGIWDVNFKLASFMLGEQINEQEARRLFQGRYEELKNGDKWFIKDFIKFQYGHLNDRNNVHSSVLRELDKEGISDPSQTLTSPLSRPLPDHKDKDKVKDKDTNKDKNKDNCIYRCRKCHKEFDNMLHDGLCKICYREVK
jgi:hypothetical protein